MNRERQSQADNKIDKNIKGVCVLTDFEIEHRNMVNSSSIPSFKFMHYSIQFIFIIYKI